MNLDDGGILTEGAEGVLLGNCYLRIPPKRLAKQKGT